MIDGGMDGWWKNVFDSDNSLLSGLYDGGTFHGLGYVSTVSQVHALWLAIESWGSFGCLFTSNGSFFVVSGLYSR